MDEAGGRLEALERRVEVLERRGAKTGSRRAPAAADLRQVDGLRRRRGPRYARAGMRGAVVYAGAARFGERETLWIEEHGLPAVWDLAPRTLARVLGALAHPARLALARALLEAPKTSQELQQVIGAGSAGPLYHHLKEMVAAGVVHQGGRSRYEVAPQNAVPLIALMAAAGDIRSPRAASGGPEGEED